ncbi:hypothetical protein B7707_03370 [Streptococcus oralis subsp. dentisani]|uniref:Uncharacterized protein n=1 Tax=Streptococcus oralis subsp. dentisani TaxID=1458253 RepID=A0A1X1IY49_STROR|nr:hypothetical protein B7707_03370 [Streptococcus oralis subsp. dentisani]
MFLALRQKLETQECPGDVFSPVPLNKRELVSLGDCISPASRNKKKQERSGNIFTLTLKIKTVSNSRGRFQHTLKFIVASD